MKKISKFFLFFYLPLLIVMVAGCKDDEVGEENVVPAITQVNPDQGMVGDEITLTGTGFEHVSSVRFGTVEADNFNVSGSTIQVTVPEAATAGTQMITVSSPGGTDTVEFTVISDDDDDEGDDDDDDDGDDDEHATTITSFSPASGVAGTEVTITGTNLHLVSSAMLGETEIMDFEASEDGSSATFSVPEDAVSGFIILTTEEGDEVRSAEEFTVDTVDAGSIAFSPAQGPVGTAVTITGADFSETTAVRLGETTIEDFEVAEDGNSISFTVPQGATSGLITVTTPAEELTSVATFTVEEEVAGELNFSPASGPVGTEVTLTGLDFTGATAISLGDTNIEDFEVSEDGSSITFLVPEGAANGYIVVSTAAGDIESSHEFVVEQFLVIYTDALDPNWSVGHRWDVAQLDLESTEQTLVGDHSIKIAFSDEWGGVRFDAGEALSLTGDETIILSVYAAQGAGNVKLILLEEGQAEDWDEQAGKWDEVTLDLAETGWKTFAVPVSRFFNGSTNLVSFGIRNMEVDDSIIYVDDIRIEP